MSISKMANSILQEFLIIDQADLLLPLWEIELNDPLPKAFVANTSEGLRSVWSSATLPYQLVDHSIHQRHFDRIHTAERIRSLKVTEFGEKVSQEHDDEALKIAKTRMREFVLSEEGGKVIRDGIIADLYNHLGSDHIKSAASELLVQTAISIWSVFESAVRAFIIEWINADPRRENPVRKSKELAKYFGNQAIDIQILGEHGFDLTSSMGDILFRNRRLDSLAVIRAVLEALFSNSDVRASLDEDMWILNQRRHLLVHRRGIVDEEYITKTGDDVLLGMRLIISSADIEKYILAVRDAVLAIAHAAEESGKPA